MPPSLRGESSFTQVRDACATGMIPAMRWGRWILGKTWVVSVALSAVLFVAVVGIWGRSYWRNDSIVHTAGTAKEMRSTHLQLSHGHAVLSSGWMRVGETMRQVTITLSPGGWTWDTDASGDRRVMPENAVAGFGYETFEHKQDAIFGLSGWSVSVPLWFIALLCLPLPLIEVRRCRMRRRIQREGLCKVCGYDLRASPERCPECGTGI